MPAALDNDTDLLNKKQRIDQISANIPTTTTQPPTLLPTIPQAPKHIVDVDVPKELPSGGGFIEPLITNSASAKNAIRISDTTRDRVQKEEPASDKCGTAESTPAYLPCYSRQVTDSLFGKCCRESVSQQNLKSNLTIFVFRFQLNVDPYAHMNIAKTLRPNQ